MRISFPVLASVAIVSGLAFLSGIHSARAQGASYKIIAFTGQPAPDGGAFEYFQTPSLGANGSISFVGEGYRGDSSYSAIYAGTAGNLHKVISLGDGVPGEPDFFFESFGQISVSKDGYVGFNASAYDGEGSFSDIWVESANGVLPNSTPKSSTFNIATLGGVAFRSGTVFAKSQIHFLPEGGEGVLGPLIGALIKKASGSFIDLLEEGTAFDNRYLASVYDGSTYPNSVGTSVDVNESGQAAVKVGVRPGPSPTPYSEAIYAGEPGDLKLVAKQGGEAPGIPDVMVDHLSPRPSIAANGFVAFSADLYGEGPESAIFSGTPTLVGPAAVEGALVPTTADVHFSTLSDAVVNSTGDVIFRARIYYPNESSREGIWIKRISGDPVLIAISGMMLATPDGDRVVESVDFAGPGTFNDLHQFVFRATFEDGDQGIYMADTRPGAPVIFVRTPRKPRDFVTTKDQVEVSGLATDDTGVAKVEYTVSREVFASKRGGKHGLKKKPKRFVVSPARRTKGDAQWSFKVPLSIGLNLISIVATDKLGNESEPYKIRMLRYDPEAK